MNLFIQHLHINCRYSGMGRGEEATGGGEELDHREGGVEPFLLHGYICEITVKNSLGVDRLN
jgi:hypothetical protein